MPIICNEQIHRLSQDDFGAIAYEVMRHAFEIHNEMGRFFDEQVYQESLRQRLGGRAWKEVLIRLAHGDFEKVYRLDLLVDGGSKLNMNSSTAPSARRRDVHSRFVPSIGIHPPTGQSECEI